MWVLGSQDHHSFTTWQGVPQPDTMVTNHYWEPILQRNPLRNEGLYIYMQAFTANQHQR